MSGFKAKIHHNRFRLGLRPDPARGAYSALRPPSWNKGNLLLREGKGCKKKKGRRGRGRQGRGGKEREGRKE